MAELPCDGEGKCMKCSKKPTEGEKLVCKTCATPWHVECLASPPQSMSLVRQWECPDCSDVTPAAGGVIVKSSLVPASDLVAKIREIENDETLTEQQKAKKRQCLMSGKTGDENDMEEEKVKDDNEILEILGDNIKCSFCMQLPQRPVTTPCGHNFCLRCFEKWVGQGKQTCAKCRKLIPDKMRILPRINASLVLAIRMARVPSTTKVAAPRVIQFVHNEDLPEKAFTTSNAKKSGNANAKSGRIFVTIPNDYLGPITEEYDPVKKMGVLVGDSWEDRLACRQWGAHFPHVAGIAGQAKYAAQSVVLSGGYEDDEDHGEWFLYTGSGGRDLSGNKRTNKEQTSDQKFTLGNEALRQSCRKGYPVRVVRSFKEKRSNYAPETGVRYDGVYRIEKCWRKPGKQIFKVCRYLFVRCDNSPAPWTSDEHGDRPRPLPKVPELKFATDLTERKESPHWDFDEKEGCWKWVKLPPPSSATKGGKGKGASRPRKNSKAKILKEFSCLICHKVLTLPVTTPCAHNFCKSCLDGAFKGQSFVRERNTGGRQLRTQKTVMKCPSCTMNISEFLQNVQVNRELMGVIESLTRKFEEEEKAEAAVEEESSGNVEDEEEEDPDEEEEDPDDEVAEDDEAVGAENELLESDGIESKPVEEVADMSIKKSEGENGNASEAVKDSDGGDKPDPSAVPAKRGRKRKNVTSEKPSGKNDADRPDPSVPAKRGRKRKNDGGTAGAGAGAARRTRGRKAQTVADDGNVSPSSPLHVLSDNELE